MTPARPCCCRGPLLSGAQVKCGWAGLGSVGCGGRTCQVYVKGAYATNLIIHMHELGHTQGLSHAARGSDEVGGVAGG